MQGFIEISGKSEQQKWTFVAYLFQIYNGSIHDEFGIRFNSDGFIPMESAWRIWHWTSISCIQISVREFYQI